MAADGDELKRRIQELKDSPGYKIHAEMNDAKASLRAVSKNKEELASAIEALKRQFVGIPSVDLQSGTAEHALEDVARRMESFLWSASGLLDYTRRHNQARYGRNELGREVQSEFDRKFVYAPDHRLSQVLRNVSNHVEVLQPAQRPKMDSPYAIPVGQLLAWDELRDDQKKLLESMPGEFDVEGFVERYYKTLEDFFGWLWKKQTEAHAAELGHADELRVSAKELYDRVFPPA
ncbi:MAG: hypothetical protein JRN09_03950 [Nitrososphaerota archaeon]|jgi:hypothetical protein|nr:hypothetical protein [Nitrososphaerota archaeon]